MEKVKIGIAGLDHMLNGGLVARRSYLITGGPGAGKTILSMQFLLEGAANKEKGVYIALEERGAELIEDMGVFGWDLHNIKIIDTIQEPDTKTWSLRSDSVVSKPDMTLSNLVSMIEKKIETYNATRIVLDSITTIRMLYESEIAARKDILSLMNFLNTSGCTSLLTVESPLTDRIGMEEFLASGVIKLHMINKEGETVNAISVEKMRGMAFDKHMRPMKITNKGIEVFPSETLFG